MARLFDDASSEYLEIDSAPVTAAPFTLSLWLYTDDGLAWQAPFYLGDKDSADNEYWRILFNVTVSLYWQVKAGGSANAATVGGLTANAWHHIAGIEATSSSRTVYLDGTQGGTDINNRVPAGADRFTLARMGDSSPDTYYSGRLADVAIWNVALSGPEVTALADGASPLTIRPGSIVAYWPLVRDEDQDVVGGYDLTAFNTPSIATHPPGLYGRAMRNLGLTVGAPGPTYIPRPPAAYNNLAIY